MKVTRIAKELEELITNPPDYIYVDYNDDDLSTIEVLFIGPRYTPYSRMFFRFRVRFGEEYPIKPPKITFESSYGRKIHPNIFPGGWICLSTLNTDENAGWAPSIRLSALLVTIYSMLSEEMIKTDNTHTHDKSSEFFPAVMYDCFYITRRLLHEEQNPKFRQIMTEYVDRHREWYIRKLERLSEQHDGKVLPNYYENYTADFKSLIPGFVPE